MPSSVIASVNYDPVSATLIIEYLSGMVYHYKSVPEKIYKELKAAGSKGRYLNYHVKGKFIFEKVEL